MESKHYSYYSSGFTPEEEDCLDQALAPAPAPARDAPYHAWEEFGHEFGAGELEQLKRSIAEMALSRIEGPEELYVGG